ncbi:hypothetical protein SADUNF_Sadunf13G0105200 [Salix dunnii]|uniref:Uncharacterized protein n=1 Tax=Salix dunnii TaxID=1413687 RepID=A0A835JLJ7_9ROSI|nr:hypothetical protein SADUNF_Sadunf13G0105200 [Salix dunnii]
MMSLSHLLMDNLRRKDISCKSLIWISSSQYIIDNSSRDGQHCNPLGRASNLQLIIINFFKEDLNSRKSPEIDMLPASSIPVKTKESNSHIYPAS